MKRTWAFCRGIGSLPFRPTGATASFRAVETMAKLLRSIEQADPNVLRLSAHTVLGSLRIFECPTASEYARQIEEIGKIRKQEKGDLTNEELTQAKDLWGRLNEQFSLILPAMEERIKKK